MANRRFIDFPIASTVGDSDIILIWQSGANKQTTKATFLSGLPENLDELNDVAISGLTNGQILRYDSVTGKWENTDQGNLDLNDLNDVSIVSPSNGQVLVYNSSTSKWENSSGGYVPYTGAVTTVNLGAQTIQAGQFVKAGGTSSQFLKADGSVDSTAYGTGSVTSVALTMPSAFNVANSPITTAGTLAVTGAGNVGQYIRGDGSLADFPQASGGGSSVSYYLNGSISQGTIGGVAYKELNKVPILGAGTDFTINADGYIASFLTDAGDPNLLEIAGGNWNFETYFSASSSGGTPTFYVELYKYDGTTFTLIASSSTSPELIAFGTNLNPYFSTLAVPTTTLALTDRLAVRFYVTHSGRTITMHTENNTLCQIVTTFTTGLTSLNGLTAQVQNLAVGTSGTDFNIASATATHTFNLPTASATNRGALSSSDWSLFTQAYNDKINSAAVTGTTTKTLTLTQQDGGTITASWSDLNTDAVTSVFGRTGAVVAANGDYTTAQVTESGNLYYTEARVSANTDVAANTAARHNAVTLGTANGLSLSTQQLSLALASGSTTGALSSTDWTTFNNKQNALTNPVTGTGASGQVAYFNGTTSITSESNLFWDATNDRLGIGTNLPSVKLNIVETDETTAIQVNDASTAQKLMITNTSITIGRSSGSNANFKIGTINQTWGANGGNLLLQTNGSENIRIWNSTGNVNIGPAPASDNGARLQVSGAATVSGLLSLDNSTSLALSINSSTNNPYIRFQQSGVSKFFIGERSATSGDGGTGYDIYAASGNDLRFFAGATKALTLASTGAATFSSTVRTGGVSIGVAPTANILDVRGENNTFDGTIIIGARGALQHRDGGQTITSLANDYNSDSAKMEFRMKGNTTSDAKMTILGSGNVLIGTTTDTGYKLRVNGSVLAGNHVVTSGSTAPALNATGTLASGVSYAIIAIYETTNTGKGCILLMAAGVLTLVSNPSGDYTTTVNTANKWNVTVSSGVISIQNNRASGDAFNATINRLD